MYKGDGQSVVVAMVMGVEVSPEAPLYVRNRAGSGTQAGNMTTRKKCRSKEQGESLGVSGGLSSSWAVLVAMDV